MVREKDWTIRKTIREKTNRSNGDNAMKYLGQYFLDALVGVGIAMGILYVFWVCLRPEWG